MEDGAGEEVGARPYSSSYSTPSKPSSPIRRQIVFGMQRPPAIGPERRWRPFVSIVLSVFMAGLAFGSWGGGRLARRLEASGAVVPLRLYATTEFIIGSSGLAVPRQLDWGGALLATAGTGVDWNSASYYIATGGWITLTLLPYAIGHVVAAPRDEKAGVVPTGH